MSPPPDSDLSRALESLLSGDLLWASCFEPESVELMGSLWPQLDEQQSARLFDYVMQGPPPEPDGLPAAVAIVHRLWVLARADSSKIPEAAHTLISEAEAAYGSLSQLAAWGPTTSFVTTFGDPSQSDITAADMEKLTAQELGQLLVVPMDPTSPFDDSHHSRLSVWGTFAGQNPRQATSALGAAANRGNWAADYWGGALQAFAKLKSQETAAEISLDVVNILVDAPADFLAGDGAWAVCFWLPELAGHIPIDDDAPFWVLWDRLADLLLSGTEPGTTERDPLTIALNRPPGRLAETVIRRFFMCNPKRDGGIPRQVEPRLRRIASSVGEGHRIARVMLARRLTPLYLTDAAWTETYVVPWFNWSDKSESSAAWRGFLSAGTVDPAVFAAILPAFLDTLRYHDEDVYESQTVLWQALVLLSLEAPGSITAQEVQSLLRDSTKGRRIAAQQIFRMMPGAPDAGAEFWNERLGPWIGVAWPRDVALRDPRDAVYLGKAAIKTGKAFPNAARQVLAISTPSTKVFDLLHDLTATALPEEFPEEVLSFLASLVSPEAQMWGMPGLRDILARIADKNIELRRDQNFTRLDLQLRRVDQ